MDHWKSRFVGEENLSVRLYKILQELWKRARDGAAMAGTPGHQQLPRHLGAEDQNYHHVTDAQKAERILKAMRFPSYREYNIIIADCEFIAKTIPHKKKSWISGPLEFKYIVRTSSEPRSVTIEIPCNTQTGPKGGVQVVRFLQLIDTRTGVCYVFDIFAIISDSERKGLDDKLPPTLIKLLSDEKSIWIIHAPRGDTAAMRTTFEKYVEAKGLRLHLSIGTNVFDSVDIVKCLFTTKEVNDVFRTITWWFPAMKGQTRNIWGGGGKLTDSNTEWTPKLDKQKNPKNESISETHRKEILDDMYEKKIRADGKANMADMILALSWRRGWAYTLVSPQLMARWFIRYSAQDVDLTFANVLAGLLLVEDVKAFDNAWFAQRILQLVDIIPIPKENIPPEPAAKKKKQSGSSSVDTGPPPSPSTAFDEAATNMASSGMVYKAWQRFQDQEDDSDRSTYTSHRPIPEGKSELMCGCLNPGQPHSDYFRSHGYIYHQNPSRAGDGPGMCLIRAAIKVLYQDRQIPARAFFERVIVTQLRNNPVLMDFVIQWIAARFTTEQDEQQLSVRLRGFVPRDPSTKKIVAPGDMPAHGQPAARNYTMWRVFMEELLGAYLEDGMFNTLLGDLMPVIIATIFQYAIPAFRIINQRRDGVELCPRVLLMRIEPAVHGPGDQRIQPLPLDPSYVANPNDRMLLLCLQGSAHYENVEKKSGGVLQMIRGQPYAPPPAPTLVLREPQRERSYEAAATSSQVHKEHYASSQLEFAAQWGEQYASGVDTDVYFGPMRRTVSSSAEDMETSAGQTPSTSDYFGMKGATQAFARAARTEAEDKYSGNIRNVVVDEDEESVFEPDYGEDEAPLEIPTSGEDTGAGLVRISRSRSDDKLETCVSVTNKESALKNMWPKPDERRCSSVPPDMRLCPRKRPRLRTYRRLAKVSVEGLAKGSRHEVDASKRMGFLHCPYHGPLFELVSDIGASVKKLDDMGNNLYGKFLQYIWRDAERINRAAQNSCLYCFRYRFADEIEKARRRGMIRKKTVDFLLRREDVGFPPFEELSAIVEAFHIARRAILCGEKDDLHFNRYYDRNYGRDIFLFEASFFDWPVRTTANRTDSYKQVTAVAITYWMRDFLSNNLEEQADPTVPIAPEHRLQLFGMLMTDSVLDIPPEVREFVDLCMMNPPWSRTISEFLYHNGVNSLTVGAILEFLKQNYNQYKDYSDADQTNKGNRPNPPRGN